MVVTSCVSPVLPSGSADCLTTDGRVVTIRPAEPADAAALVALHERSSDRTRYFRYFSVQRQLDEDDARRFVTVDHRGREALVVLERGTVVGIGGYDSLADPSIAELSFLVDDAHQRRGIGSLLLEHLSERARARGFHYLEASVLATNHLMLDVFTLAGFQQRHQLEDGVVELLLDLDDPSVARPSDRGARARGRRRLDAADPPTRTGSCSSPERQSRMRSAEPWPPVARTSPARPSP